MSEYLRDRRIWVRIGNTLSDEFYPEEGVATGGVLAVTCFGLKINELPSLIATDIFRALFVDDLAICFRGRSLDTIERHLQQAVNAIQEWATRNGFRFADHKCKVVHFTAPRYKAQRPPYNQDQWHTPGSWGINKIPWAVVGFAPLLQRAHQCTKDSVQEGSQSNPSGCTGTRGILHQPSLQYVHGGQRSSFGGTSVEVAHELLSENSCLHWQPSTSWTTWIWPNHKRSVSP